MMKLIWTILILTVLVPTSVLFAEVGERPAMLAPTCSGNPAADTAAISALVRSIGSKTATISLGAEEGANLCRVNDLSLPPNITLNLTNGPVYVETGKTLSLHSVVVASETAPAFLNALAGQGTVVFSKGATVRPQWWGAKGDDVADDTLPIQAALKAAPGGVVLLSVGTFFVTNTLNILTDNTQLVGSGFYTSVIHCNPAAERACIDIHSSKRESVSFVGVHDLGVLSTNIVKKTAIRITDGTEVLLENVKINGIVSTNKDSVGLELRGRQLQTFRNLTITADRPIVLDDDPNTIYDSDHYHFENLYLVANQTQPCISVAGGINISNLTFDGYQSWIQCRHGFYFRDTTTTNIAFALTIKNARWEQNTDDEGYFVYVNHNTRLDGLIIENLYGGGVHGRGLYLRKINTATITNFQYQGALEVLNVDTTDRQFIFLNPAWGNGTLTLNGFTDYESLPRGALTKIKSTP
jgi:Pectate lyase superfamily protein